MRKNVHGFPKGIADVEAPDTPWLIGDSIADLETVSCCTSIDFIDVIDLNREIGNASTAILICGFATALDANVMIHPRSIATSRPS
jgi:hypothetical protein